MTFSRVINKELFYLINQKYFINAKSYYWKSIMFVNRNESLKKSINLI